MATKTTGDARIDALYKVRKGKVDFVDVPELGFVMIDGGGAPEAPAFSDAIQALYSVSYGAHFGLKKETGSAPRVMALESLWWVEGDALAVMQAVAAGEADITASDRDDWRWRAMIVQLPPIDEDAIRRAVAVAGAKRDLPSLRALRYERWTEGACAQIMHIGPYATESASIVTLHRAIADHGSRARGHHHEIYLGDPRTAAPEKLRTILRQPVEPAPGTGA